MNVWGVSAAVIDRAHMETAKVSNCFFIYSFIDGLYSQSYDILDMHQHLNRHFLCYIHFFYFYNNRQAPQNAAHPDGNFRRGALLLYVVIMLLHNHFHCFFACTNHVESGCHSDDCLAVNLCRRRQAAVDCVDVHAACKAFYND